MNLTDLQAAVVTETKRPDLVPETLQKVLEATLSCHLTDNYIFDIVESQVVFNDCEYIQELDLTLIPQFRAANYLRKAPLDEYNKPIWRGRERNFLKHVDLSDVIDNYGYEKQDVWYQAGTQINIKSSTRLQYLLLGYYTYPMIGNTDATYSSWIAANMPYVIIYRAAGTIFQMIGETSSANNYLRPPAPGNAMDEGGMYYSQLGLLKRTQILANAW